MGGNPTFCVESEVKDASDPFVLSPDLRSRVSMESDLSKGLLAEVMDR
jgi:hypothetical protein